MKNEGLKMALKWDKKVKEEIIRCVIENKLERMSVVRNVVLQCRKEIIDKYLSEVIKSEYSDDHCE